MDTTNEFSFVLKPSEHRIGVFAAHDIKNGTFLRLFGDDRHPEESRMLSKETVPAQFRHYCIDRGSQFACPDDFGAMHIGWYLNHSHAPNAAHRKYQYYAIRDIAAGEEILIDYNTLEEPDEVRESYYRKN